MNWGIVVGGTLLGYVGGRIVNVRWVPSVADITLLGLVSGGAGALGKNYFFDEAQDLYERVEQVEDRKVTEKFYIVTQDEDIEDIADELTRALAILWG